ncbi:AAA family ATPase [Spirosoma foliorum]|uniref:DUF3696 domain-containing protein n=1 Tax=Spirosoma foliorum TaxID=2710596 RepID=A0A7G5H1S6_9BACT|nr:DUF3696 domain-containing protein [Spirosoma foliorum]QMW05068.1 DUF3696 domain-containing protein [Spirosoma foliorum]
MLINSLSLKNFKCFEELDVKFAPITLLTGANSSGKSSLINAILAVLQTEEFPLYLSPNGKYLNMGSYEEIVFGKNLTKNVGIKLQPYSFIWRNFKPIFEWIWEYDESNDLPRLKELSAKFEANAYVQEEWSMDVRREYNNYKFSLDAYAPDIRFPQVREALEKVDSLKNHIQPASQKKGPDIHLKVNRYYHHLKEIAELYNNPNFYFRDALRNVFPDRNFNYVGSFRHPPERTYYQKSKAQSKIDSDGSGYIDQIIEWEQTNPEKLAKLNEVMRQLELFSEVQSTMLKGGRFELNIKTQPKANFTALTDVGFGISQFLPIIVADLQLQDQSCLAVSQPEIHLHPKIQAQFGNYLSNQINSTQKQYIIETHSEYLLNRIRLLLVNGELHPTQVRVLYFENDGTKSKVYNIEFAIDGQIKGAPQGFFDTYGIDVMDIALNAH